MREWKALICSWLIGMCVTKKYQVTVSLHGGVVREPV
jgi:hypothetical protein